MDELRITQSGQRLDKWLVSDSMSRSRAAALIQQGHVRVNGKVVTKSSFIPDIDDIVAIDVPGSAETVDKAEDIPLRILYEDDALAVVDKPCGMVVHPAAGNQSGTLVNALLYHLDSLSGIGGERRPGIVHRLDKDTSGLLIVAKDDRAHAALSRQLAERKMEKHYLAVVAGQMKEPEGRIDLPIGRSPKDRKKMAVHPEGRTALTEWRVLDQRPDRALLDVRLITGRTHQIRVHMAALHHPVLGDPLYGVRGMPAAPRLMLHAWRLAFAHPVTGETLRLTAEPDSIFALPKEVEPWR
ncbi:MAG: RluA family pseudouridine synthase [Clostridiales bacterium]|nr:RluA family pseudouridine synthase [Clostridiales bacterium]